MEYIEGPNLKDYSLSYFNSESNGAVPMDSVKLIAKKLLEGIAYLHENKIIHRDLKVFICM